MSEATHIITETVIIPGVARFEAGDGVTEKQAGDSWAYLEQNGFLKSLEAIEAEADAVAGDGTEAGDDSGGGSNPDASSDDSSEVTTPDALEQIKVVLADKKLQKAGIAEALGVAPEVVAPLLTAENGIEHAGGWYSLPTPANA